MADGAVSQRTIMQAKYVFQNVYNKHLNYGDRLYENNFPDWFVIHVAGDYSGDWTAIFVELRRGTFFFSEDITGFRTSIIPNNPFMSPTEARLLGEHYVQKLAAFACTLSGSEGLVRSLQLDGFDVDKTKLVLVPLEGPVSAQQEEDRLTRLVKGSGLPQSQVVLQHIQDAFSLYAEGKDHASLNESRNLIQSLIDEISTETDAHGKHSTKLPGGTANRIEYLKNVGFFTSDEEASFKSAWGSLSAGSHPGVPEREQVRIGLVLALEFGQLLVMKFANWRANAYLCFK